MKFWKFWLLQLSFWRTYKILCTFKVWTILKCLKLYHYSFPLEFNKRLEEVSEFEYVGLWSLTDPSEKKLLSNHIDNVSGYAKTDLYYFKEGDRFPIFRIVNILYDGEYRDQVVYNQISFNDLRINSQEENKLTIYEKNKASINTSYGRLYTIIQEYKCYIDFSATFDDDGKAGFNATFTMKSDGQCFPKEVTLVLHSIKGSSIKQNRVINYSFILNFLLLTFCYIISKQSHMAEENQAFAQRISMITLCWNWIWNFWSFNIHLSYSLQFREYGYFSIPACLYFVLWFVFELKLLLLCWKAKNQDIFRESNEAVRRALIGFYIKFYLAALICLVTIDRLMANKYTLFIIWGAMLIPQIVENVIYNSRNTPRYSFLVLLAITQSFFALYSKGWPNNILDLKPDQTWALLFGSFIILQLMILYMQKICGPRFFIPKACRFWNEYNYYRKFHEDLEQGENTDGGHTCCICLNPLSFQEESQEPRRQTRKWMRFFNYGDESDSEKVYMVTPCGHKYHPACLKSWMKRKLEWPFWRAPIPQLEEEY